jgi:acyl-CoA synthetase (AMP-forming)/AMP-acid ligase II
MTPLPQTLDEHYDAALRKLKPHHTILMDEGNPISFQEFQLSVRRQVAALKLAGVIPGQMVGYSVPNGLAAFTLPLAISRIGAACLPMYVLVPDEFRCAAFAQARATFVVVPGESADNFRQIAAAKGMTFSVLTSEELLQADPEELPPAISVPDQPFLFATSSGTTGQPKPVFMTQRNVASALSAAYDLSSYGPWRTDSDYRAMIAFPQSTSGIMILLGTAFLGVCQVFTRSLSPARFLEIAHAVDAEAFSAPPAWLEALLSIPVNATNRVPSLRGVAAGMDFVSPSLLQRLGVRFPDMDSVANGYGLVETATVFMIWKGDGKESFAGPTGRLTLCEGLGNEIRVVTETGEDVAIGEEGELWTKGPSVITSYLGNTQGFQDGWFRTGDYVVRESDTTVELRGRRKYLIKRGGKSVSPLVVQEAVDRSPGILRSAVVGIPHALYGEMVWAFAVAQPGAEPSTASVMKSVRAELPSHMVPDRVEFVETIPLGKGVGKVDREALIAQGKALLEKLGVQG